MLYPLAIILFIFRMKSLLLRLTLPRENIRFSSLLATKDFSRGITSATQRQKFYTDDVKSVRNPVRGTDWSTE